jgi:Co/Zn/Cd efflux system component
VIDEAGDDAAILSEMTRILAERFNIIHTTIQLDRRPEFVQIQTSRGPAGS